MQPAEFDNRLIGNSVNATTLIKALGSSGTHNIKMVANIGLKVAGAILVGTLASSYHSSVACLSTSSS